MEVTEREHLLVSRRGKCSVFMRLKYGGLQTGPCRESRTSRANFF